MNTFIIDIDGTICNAEKIKDGYDYPNATPINSVIYKINELYKKGHTIILFTARGYRTYNGDTEKIEKIHRPILEKWLYENNVSYHKLITGKPWGENPIYIDNRNLSLNSFLQNNEDIYEEIVKQENLI